MALRYNIHLFFFFLDMSYDVALTWMQLGKKMVLGCQKKKRLGTTGMGVKRCQRTKQKCEEFDLSECGGLLLEE